MKITRLSFKNINSLAGAWTIDFAGGGYYDSGLFAILGNTASGKTSILDAMCLALYGESPRGLGPAECASWNTPDSFAEVTYEAKGREYVSKYTISANTRGVNKGKYTGKNADFMLTQTDGAITLATGIRQVHQKNTELIGLDATQFQRVVMLAQGSFDKFLLADERDRAEILAKITSMEQYDRIGWKVRERFSQEAARLASLEVLCQNANLLSDDDLERLNARLGDLETEKSDAEKRRNELDGLLKCCDAIRAAQADVDKWAGEAQKLSADRESFRLQAPVLALADACEPIQRGSWAAFSALDREQKADAAAAVSCAGAIQKLEDKRAGLAEDAQAAETALKAALDEQARTAPVIDAVKALDTAISHDGQLLAEQRRDESRRRKQLKTDGAMLEKLQQVLDGKTREVSAAKTYVAEHGADAELAVRNAGWQAQFRALENESAAVKAAGDAAASARQSEGAAAKACRQAQSAIGKATQALAECAGAVAALEAAKAQTLAGKTREDMAARIEELYFADSADMLAKLRAELQDGAVCPLCGSVHHPYLESHPEDGAAKAERDVLKAALARLDDMEKQLSDMAAKKLKADGDLARAQDKLEMLAAAWTDKQTAAASAETAAQQAEDAWKAHADALQAELAVGGFDGWTAGAPLPTAISQRMDAYAAATRNIQAFADEKAALETELAGRTAAIDAQKSELVTLEKAIESLDNSLNDRRQERRGLFGDKLPDAESARLAEAVERARRRRDACQNALTECAARLAARREEAATLENARAERQPKLDDAASRFADDCQAAHIEQEDFTRFLALDADKIKRLRNEKQSLETRRRELDRHSQEAARQLEAEQARLAVPNDEDAWRQERDGLATRLTAIAEETGTVRTTLAADAEKRRVHEENLKNMATQKTVVDKWGRLNALIGKSNNFQRIAQQLTLEELLGLANRHIRELKMRYDLSTDIRSEQSLAIMVCDHFQGGELRNVKSLSGGERFEVSLALALGLADMVGSTGVFQVDCLFIDEGFGNLSKAELENALGLLQRLNSGVRGKMVGIITHVENIEEYLRQTIQVTSQGYGVSALAGAGVQNLEKPGFVTEKNTSARHRKK